MARKSIPNPQKTWARFVKIRIEVFCKALELLTVSPEMKSHEDEISKALNPKLKTASRNHHCKPETPSWDAKNKPETDDELMRPSSETRPDFTCKMVNVYADSDEAYEINLHIECKRIGNNNPKWNLNMNYINNGINRFDLLTHEYGKRAHDGIMIGYIIDSTKFKIQEEINGWLPENIENLNFTNNNKVECISTKFARKNVYPFDFMLHHIWADFTRAVKC